MGPLKSFFGSGSIDSLTGHASRATRRVIKVNVNGEKWHASENRRLDAFPAALAARQKPLDRGHGKRKSIPSFTEFGAAAAAAALYRIRAAMQPDYVRPRPATFVFSLALRPSSPCLTTLVPRLFQRAASGHATGRCRTPNITTASRNRRGMLWSRWPEVSTVILYFCCGEARRSPVSG